MVLGEAVRSLGGVALVAAPGVGLAEILPAIRILPWPRRLGLAYLLGIAWTAGWLYALSFWFAVPIRPLAVVAVALAPVLVGGLVGWRLRAVRWRPVDALTRCPPSPAFAARLRGRTAQRLALACGGLVAAALLAEALTNPLTDWDGRIIWSTQARYVRAEATVLPQALRDPGVSVTGRGYPLLLPVAQAAVLEIARADIDHHAFRPLYALFFPVWLLTIYGGAAPVAGREAAAWTTIAAAMLSVPAFANAGGAASTYSDLPLACFLGAGALLLLGPKRSPSVSLTAGILLAAAVLTKVEGGLLAALVVLVAALPLSQRNAEPGSALERRRGISLLFAALPVAVATALELSWRAHIPSSFKYVNRLFSWSLLWPGLLTRIPAVAHQVLASTLRFSHWGAFWWIAPWVLVAGGSALRRRPARALLVVAAAPLGMGWLYATIALDPYFIVWTTWDRSLLQASVPLLVVFAMALRDVLRGRAWPRWWERGTQRRPGVAVLLAESRSGRTPAPEVLRPEP